MIGKRNGEVLQEAALKTLEVVPVSTLDIPPKAEPAAAERARERPRSLRHDKEYTMLPRYPGFGIKQQSNRNKSNSSNH